MFIKNYLPELYNYTRKSKFIMTFGPSYSYWVETLLEYPIRLFDIEGLPDSIPEHEPDLISYIGGYVPIVQLSDGSWIAAAESNLFGLTDYYDLFTSLNFTTPLHFGKRTIGKTAFVIRNNSLKNSLMPKIERYAAMLAHTDISLICELVNLRESDVMEVLAKNQKAGAEAYLADRYEGKIATLVNQGFSMIRHNFTAQKSQHENSHIWTLRSNILAAYLEEIGIKKTNDKREREVVSEVMADNPMLKLNIRDMHKCRQHDWDLFNERTGYNVKVLCNVDYDEDGTVQDNKSIEGGVSDDQTDTTQRDV